MPLVETIAAAVQPWADWYSHSKPAQAGVTWLHVSGLVVGGGAAIAADRSVFRALRAGVEVRERVIRDFAVTHGTVLVGLAIVATSGVAMALGDVKTFLVSGIYWSKMALVVLLLANGRGLQLAEHHLLADPSPKNPAWRRLGLGSAASVALWMSIMLLGVVLSIS